MTYAIVRNLRHQLPRNVKALFVRERENIGDAPAHELGQDTVMGIGRASEV